MIYFLIVTYEPEKLLFLQHFSRNTIASSNIIIIDNSYSTGSISFIKSLEDNNITIFQNLKNIGIAAAQNIGIDIFLKGPGEYLLQLDQDSSIDEYSLKLLLDFYEINSINFSLAGVGPGSLDGTVLKVREIKSSGLLTHRSVFERVGYMNSDLFIDLVDYEWCWRTHKNFGLNFYEVPCEFLHQLGVRYKVFRLFNISIPTPIRHYYQVRNSLYLIFRIDAPIQWALFRLLIIPVKIIIYPFILPYGKERLKYMLLGIRDFIRGKTGVFD